MASEWGTSPQPKEAIMSDPYDHEYSHETYCRREREAYLIEEGLIPDPEAEADDYSDYHCDSAMEAGLFGSEA